MTLVDPSSATISDFRSGALRRSSVQRILMISHPFPGLRRGTLALNAVEGRLSDAAASLMPHLANNSAPFASSNGTQAVLSDFPHIIRLPIRVMLCSVQLQTGMGGTALILSGRYQVWLSHHESLASEGFGHGIIYAYTS